MEKESNYSEAIEELEKIVSDIEQEGISVDELSEKVKRATALIKICRTKLTKTEKEVNDALKELKPISGEESEQATEENNGEKEKDMPF